MLASNLLSPNVAFANAAAGKPAFAFQPDAPVTASARVGRVEPDVETAVPDLLSGVLNGLMISVLLWGGLGYGVFRLIW